MFWVGMIEVEVAFGVYHVFLGFCLLVLLLIKFLLWQVNVDVEVEAGVIGLGILVGVLGMGWGGVTGVRGLE